MKVCRHLRVRRPYCVVCNCLRENLLPTCLHTHTASCRERGGGFAKSHFQNNLINYKEISTIYHHHNTLAPLLCFYQKVRPSFIISYLKMLSCLSLVAIMRSEARARSSPKILSSRRLSVSSCVTRNCCSLTVSAAVSYSSSPISSIFKASRFLMITC